MVHNDNLLPALQAAFPSATSYQVLATVQQASAVGYKLQVCYPEKSSFPGTVFLKQVVATDLNKPDWADLRRALLYARTECRFYRDFAPLLHSQGFTSVPRTYLAEYNLSDLIDEDETGHDSQPTTAPPHLADLITTNKGGTLILEYIPHDTHHQDSPLSLPKCRECLTALAQLHAAAWQNGSLLELADAQLSRASFHLSMRNPKELAGIEAAWEHFVQHFGTNLQQAGVWNEGMVEMGARVAKVAQFVSNQVSVQPNDPFATLIHGDYKSMNVFLPLSPEHSALLCDFASVGLGLGMSDVAMHIHHAVRPDTDNGEEGLVWHYWQTLQEAVNDDSTYTWPIAWRHYQFAVVDYFRFFLARFWRSATPASMEKLAENKNTNLINRSIPAAVAFVARVDKYLSMVEEEYKQQEKDEL